MELYTERLILRPWREADAPSLYEYAKDPRVGPVAGWRPHSSVADSLNIIRTVLSAGEVYAVCLKADNIAIGSIGLMLGSASNLKLHAGEAELGYWIGVPFWGQGLIPEAAGELIRHAFDDLGLERLWCGYFDGNTKSRRAQEKCGFKFQRTDKDMHWELMDDIRTEHITSLGREDWKEHLRLCALLSRLEAGDTADGYSALLELERLSDDTGLLYPHIGGFISMTGDGRYAVRIRGFRLFCKQARWDVDLRIDENLGYALNILSDPRPTVVRQALAALREVVLYKPELRQEVFDAAAKIDYLRYKDTMHSLLKKDIQELLAVSAGI